MRKMVVVLLALALLLSACSSPTPTESAPAPTRGADYPAPVAGVANDVYPAPGQATFFDPQAEDAERERSEVELVLTDSSIVLLETSPKQAVLRLTVMTNNLCDNVRLRVNAPEGNKINVEAYAVVDDAMTCAEVQNLVNTMISLGSFAAGGKYEVYINEQLLGSFDS